MIKERIIIVVSFFLFLDQVM
uniref:Uncharacterized protein n=1 Tax=Arundo donax TaxID=35708 RepID=A0A0A8ZPP7_ARUDO